MPIVVLLLLACAAPVPEEKDDVVVIEPRQVPPPTFVETRPERLIAIGDVHGDFKATRDVLKLAGVIDQDNQWIAGDAWVVQTGDQLDRGDGEERILELFEDLADQAHAEGGAFHSLLGNHEIMNVDLDFEYVTPGGFDDFADTEVDPEDPLYADFPEEQWGRVAAFRPGGPWAKKLSDHNVVMQIGDTVFVHGGVLPDHVAYGLAKINTETRQWMRGREDYKPNSLRGDGSLVWTRLYSADDAEPDCASLDLVLEELGAARMVVAHTVWDGINPACDGKVWRIDVGMSAYYGGVPMALSMAGDDLEVIGAPAR